MKKYLLIILIAFFPQILFCQNTFSNKYGYSIKQAQLLEAASDGGYYFCGRTLDSDIALGKIDSIGDLEWCKKIGTAANEIPRDFTVLSNGNVVVALSSDSGAFSSLSSAYYIAFDLYGNLLYTKIFINSSTGNVHLPNNIISDGTGFVTTIRSNSPQQTRILKLDDSGNTLKSVYLEGHLHKIYKTIGNQFLLIDRFLPTINRFDSLLNHIGTSVFSFNGQASFHGSFKLSDDSFIIYGETFYDPFICKFNSQFQIDWAIGYSNITWFLGKAASGIKTSENEMTFICAEQHDGMDTRPSLLQIDTLGNLIKSNKINILSNNMDGFPTKVSSQNNQFSFIYNELSSPYNYTTFTISNIDTNWNVLCSLENDSIVYGNYTWNVSGAFFQSGSLNDSLTDAFIPISDITFQFGDCSDTILINISEVSDIENISIYPNPTNNKLNINWNSSNNLSNNEWGIIELYNLQGKILNKEEIISGKTKTISIEHLQKGIYILKLNSQKSSILRKVIIN